MTTWADPPVLPSYTLPEALEIPAPVLELPQAEIPSYTPLVVPPNTLRPPPGVEGIPLPEKPPEPAGRKKRKKEESKKETPKSVENPTPQQTQMNLPSEVQILNVPFMDVEIPMPTTEIMTAAATTSVISVGATLAATSCFKYLVTVMKPVLKQAWNKLTKKKTKPS